MKTRLLLMMTLFLSLTFQSHATTWYVNASATGNDDGSSWTDAFVKFQEALDAAATNDTIFVAKGTYKPTKPADGSSSNNRDKAFVLNKNIKIYGGFSGSESGLSARDNDSASLHVTNATILSGDLGTPNDNSDNAYHVVIAINNANGFVLDGVTITGGNANDMSSLTISGNSIPKNAGGGVFNNKCQGTYSHIVIEENHVHSDDDHQGGGGGMNNNQSDVTIEHFVFINNTADNINGGGMNNDNSSPELSDGYFNNNFADGSDQGGGAVNNNAGSDAVFTNIVFNGNATNGSGGAVYNDGSSPEFTHVLFLNDSCFGDSGGGLDCDGGSNAILNDVTFKNNYSNEDGGGLYEWKSSVTMDNVKFLNNYAEGNGGAMYHYNTCNPILSNIIIGHNFAGDNGGGMGIENNSKAIVTNLLCYENTATNDGGGLYATGSNATVILTNGTIVNNHGGGVYDQGTTTEIHNTLIVGNYPSDLDANFALYAGVHYCILADGGDPVFIKDGGGNFPNAPTMDTVSWPIFIDTLNENYHLDPNGPAIDRGDSSFYNPGAMPDISAITKDLRGADRTMGDNTDIGAYEYCSETVTPDITISSNHGTTVVDRNTVTFSAQATNGGNNPIYQWLKNNNPIVGENGDTYTAQAGVDFMDGDDISAVLISSIPCASPDTVKSDALNMTVQGDGISEIHKTRNNLIIYPNPNDGRFTIQGNFIQKAIYKITVSNLMGKTIYATQLSSNGKEIKFSVSKDLPSGIYLLTIFNGKEGQKTIKFVKK